MRVREWRPPWPLDVRLVLSPHRRGSRDPAYSVTGDGAVWRTSRTPDGPATLSVRAVPADAVVTARAWGPGADWLLERLPALLGADDDPADLRPRHPRVRDAAARLSGLRIGRTGRVLEALIPAVLEQKVPSAEAWRAWRYLLRRFGDPAPGPAPEGMRVFPSPRTWAMVPSWEWHRSGAEPVRARTIVTAARSAGRLEAAGGSGGGSADTSDPAVTSDPADSSDPAVTSDTADADRRLRSLPGIGVWTSAEVRQRAFGDPDALSVGDYHLPGIVGWALLGRKVDDVGMLELLAPYAGQRHRVARLLELSGPLPPRRGPRMPVRDYRRF